jgi:hypothetical protein
MWKHSETIAALSAALVAACGELTDVPKGREAKVQMKAGGSYGYRYADLGDALQMVRPIMAAHGLAVVQNASSPNDDTVHVSTSIIHASGEWITFEPLALPVGRTAQETGSAITYARRYHLLACLGLATDDDDGAGAAPRTNRANNDRRGANNAGNSRQAPSKPAAPETAANRTPEEGSIRDTLATLPPDKAKTIRDKFRGEFGALKDLDPARHAEALDWLQVALAFDDAADAEWVATARGDE